MGCCLREVERNGCWSCAYPRGFSGWMVLAGHGQRTATQRSDRDVLRFLQGRIQGSKRLHRNSEQRMNLVIVPITFKEANAFVVQHHRHHKPMPGCKFCVAVSNGSKVVGVAMVGRPVARMSDDGFTVEVNRVCTDGTPNACSKLYSAARRAAQALGYTRCVTYTLPEEGGASLRASNWKLIGEAGGGKWSRPSRKRTDDHPTQPKLKWQAP